MGGQVSTRARRVAWDRRKPPTRRPSCGSRSGYEAHRRANERSCDPCLDAVKERQEAYLASLPPDKREAMRRTKNARKKALAMVGRSDRRTYRRLLAEERERLLEPYRGQPLPDDPAFWNSLQDRARMGALRRMADQNPDLYQQCLRKALADREVTQ